MTTMPYRMRGMSFLGWLVILAMAVVVGSAAIRIIPAYLEFRTIIGVINNALDDRGAAVQSDMEIRDAIRRRFDVNNVTAIRPIDLPIQREGNRITVKVDYEVREGIVGKVDIVIMFKQDVEKVFTQ